MRGGKVDALVSLEVEAKANVDMIVAHSLVVVMGSSLCFPILISIPPYGLSMGLIRIESPS